MHMQQTALYSLRHRPKAKRFSYKVGSCTFKEFGSIASLHGLNKIIGEAFAKVT